MGVFCRWGCGEPGLQWRPLPDLFLAGGASAAGFFVNQSATGGALSFRQMAMDLRPEDLNKVLGAYPLDIDNDRHTDLVLLRLGRNIVLKGGPDCQFRKGKQGLWIDGGRAWSTGMSAIWEGENRFPTIAIGNYVDRSAPAHPLVPASPMRCSDPVPETFPDYSG
jgi:hypothetical protein